MPNELKPCPFCGGEAKIGDYMTYSYAGKHIKCTKCSARSGFVLINAPKLIGDGILDESTRYTKEEAIEIAIEAWNRRVDNA